MKELIRKINETARTDFSKACGMLEMLNEIKGTKFGWLGKRVVWFENPDGTTAERYAHCHDAYSTYEDPEEALPNAVKKLKGKGYSEMDAIFTLAMLAGLEGFNPARVRDWELRIIREFLHCNPDWEGQLDD